MRTGLAQRPEDYRWISLGYHSQTGNRDDFLSLDCGPIKCALLSLRELNGSSLQEFGAMDAAERLRSYRRYVYEAGGIKRADGSSSVSVDNKFLEKERKTDFEIFRLRMFRYRTRYCTDSGIVGSKEFVAANYQRFKNLFYSKHKKKPKPIKDLKGMYSLKRLSGVI